MKIVVCGNYGVSNMGDEALFEGLRHFLSEKYPYAEIQVMGKGRLFPFGFKSFLSSFFHWEKWKTPLRIVHSCDLFILGGGGLLGEEEGISVPLFWVLQGSMAKLFKKRILCLGMSMGSLGFLNTFLVRNFLKKVQGITVRDRYSNELLYSWGIKNNHFPDLSFLLPYQPVRAIDNNKKYIVVSLRRYNNFTSNMYKIFAQECDKLIEDYAINIRFLPFQDGIKNDISILNKIFELLKNKKMAEVVTFQENINNVLNILANAELTFAMRLHAGILSVLAGCPFIALSYMGKVQHYWEGKDLLPTMALRKDEVGRLSEIFKKFWNSRENYREKTMLLREKMLKDISRLADYIDN